MNNRSIHLLIYLGIISILLTGCFSKSKEFRPDQVIENALNNDESISYYAEHETVLLENNNEPVIATAKEWLDKDGSMRIETIDEDGTELIITNDMETIQIYDSTSNELLEGSIGELEEMNYSPKEEMLMLIEGIQETHTIEYVGEEDVIGRKAHHIQATPRDKTSLNGEQEFWFDAQYGVGLKTKSSFGDTKSEVTYTHFEVRNDVDQELFSIERTADMDFVDLDEIEKESQLTLEGMIDQLESPTLYVPEDDTVQIESIESLAIGSYKLDYLRDGLPFISFFIEKDSEIFNYDEDPEELQVDDLTVYYNTTMNQDIYVWVEDEELYEIWVNDPSIRQQEVLKQIKNLEYVNEK